MRRASDRFYLFVMAALTTWVLPALSRAAEDQESAHWDARLDGYKETVRLKEAGSVGVYWLLLVGLIILGTIVLFKNAKRSHLD